MSLVTIPSTFGTGGSGLNPTSDPTVNLKNILTQLTTAVSTLQTGVAPGQVPASIFKSFCSVGADASGGATHITATGVKIGDKVVMVANVTDHASASAVFEATITVADQIQQTSTNLSAKTLVILVIAQS